MAETWNPESVCGDRQSRETANALRLLSDPLEIAMKSAG